MEDRAEDPDLRIAERTWWRLIEGGSEEGEGGERFFVLAVESVEDGGFFVLPAPKIEDGGSSFFGAGRSKNPSPTFAEPPSSKRSPPPSSVRSSTHSSGPKIVDGGRSSIFASEGRRLKMGGSSIFVSVKFKMEGYILSSAPNIEDGGIFEDGMFFADEEVLRRWEGGSSEIGKGFFKDGVSSKMGGSSKIGNG